ncbi:hypothetical protein [Streptomyces sp. NPDC006510]|uniref:hypothetical protein n=1 Tax=Streptomyces sp. NPDC006510 TaxID=3155600 RepID=UPI00339E5446
MTLIAALITGHLSADSGVVGVAAEQALSDVAPQLPEMEWCNFCSYDEVCEPGMPREVVNRTVGPALPPEDWDARWSQCPPYEVTSLTCGHLLAQRC